MTKLRILIACNALVLAACVIEVYGEISKGFEGIKAHHGLMLYMFAELIIRIKEAFEASKEIKEVRETY